MSISKKLKNILDKIAKAAQVRESFEDTPPPQVFGPPYQPHYCDCIYTKLLQGHGIAQAHLKCKHLGFSDPKICPNLPYISLLGTCRNTCATIVGQRPNPLDPNMSWYLELHGEIRVRFHRCVTECMSRMDKRPFMSDVQSAPEEYFRDGRDAPIVIG